MTSFCKTFCGSIKEIPFSIFSLIIGCQTEAIPNLESLEPKQSKIDLSNSAYFVFHNAHFIFEKSYWFLEPNN